MKLTIRPLFGTTFDEVFIVPSLILASQTRAFDPGFWDEKIKCVQRLVLLSLHKQQDSVEQDEIILYLTIQICGIYMQQCNI